MDFRDNVVGMVIDTVGEEWGKCVQFNVVYLCYEIVYGFVGDGWVYGHNREQIECESYG
jgi:hypothetical protein